MEFSEKIRALRIDRGLSQERLAEQFDVSRQTISKWEAGTTLPEVDKLIALSDFFQVSIDYLLRDKQLEPEMNGELDRMVIRFLNSSYEMSDVSRQLVRIMEDGVIDSEEMHEMEQIVCELDNISAMIKRMREVLYANRSQEE